MCEERAHNIYIQEEKTLNFKSNWITTQDFCTLKPLNVFHKELEKPHVQYADGPQNYHVYFRKKIIADPRKETVLFISADDYYKLYINGTFVCQGPAPAYPHSYNYNKVDITSFLKEGENIFAVHVYYQGLINRVWNSGDNRMGLIADIYVDGKYFSGTDSSWYYHIAKEYSGDTIGYETQFLENIDFRQKHSLWKEPDFSDKDYLSALVNSDDDHTFREQPAECLSVYRIQPTNVVHLKEGHYFIDFGSEIVGQFTMKICGEHGQKIKILCGEETTADNHFLARSQMRCNCSYEEECILSGHPEELEFFDYKAFRYVNIFSELDNLKPDSFAAIVRHHKFKENFRITSNIPWIEPIWKLCVNTLKWGCQEGFLDCPSREKGQYLGDFTVSGLAHMYITGDYEMYRNTLFAFAETAGVCKGLLSVAPGSFMQEIADFSLQYPMQVWHYYKYTNDIDTLLKLYPVLCNLMEYFAQYERADGLISGVNDKWNLIDWPVNLRDGYDIGGEDHSRPNPCHNVLNAHYIGAHMYMQKIQHVLNFPLKDNVEQRKEAFIKAFFDEKTGIFYDTEERNHSALHSNVLPVFYEFAPTQAWDTIKDIIMKKGLACGTCFSYFVLKALGKMNAYEEELALLTNDSIHSWVNMLREGATTCFEAWGKDQKHNTSLCHAWSCAPIIVLLEDLNFAIKKQEDYDE